MSKISAFLNKYLLAVVILMQPFLDVLAFFTASEKGTASGYIRLAIMAGLFLYALGKERKNRLFLFASLCAAAVFALHILNGFRCGYSNFTSDFMYAAKTAYMPVMAISFCGLIKKDETRDLVLSCLTVNAAVEILVVLLSYLTGTYTTTYGPGLGISGWVIEDNRCCHSDIISSLCIYLALFGITTGKKYMHVFAPIAITALFLTNGTSACYLTLLAIMAGYPAFLLVRSLILKEKLTRGERISSIVMASLFAFSIIIYPVTPRYKMEEIEHSFYSDTQIKFEKKMEALGYDLYAMTPQEKMENEEVHDCLVEYYKPFMFSGVPSMMRKFDIDRIMWKYNVTHDATILGDNREMKQVYASLLFEDSDFLTRITGFEFATIGEDLTADLENDWVAVFFYYGYFGFAILLLGVLFLILRIILTLKNNFRKTISLQNFCILMAFFIALGLGYFSGATMRRPNASIYLSLAAALIYYQTGRKAYEA